MSVVKDMFIAVVNIFSKQLYFIAALASIIGVTVIILKKEWAIYIALSFFCLMLLIFTLSLIYTLFKIISVGDNEFESISTFVKYETSDSNKIVYETYRLIQSKKPILTEFLFSFKWSGTHMPVVTSNLQKVKNVIDDKDPTKYDKAILQFQKPLYYNKNEVIHFKAELDDADRQSDTYVANRIIQEVDIIHYRIILKYKQNDYDKNAILERQKLNSIGHNYQKIKEIPFDNTTKSYEFHLLKPEIGYNYRIIWER